MRAYVDNFSADATLDLVFRDLHAKAKFQARALDELVDHSGRAAGRANVPDTPLWINWNGLEGRDGHSFLTNIVQIAIGPNLRPFAEVSSYLPRPGGVWRPTRVGGNRDHESWAEALISRQEGEHSYKDVITVKLGETGLNGVGDLAGTTRERAGTRLKELSGEDLRRVELAAQSILDDVAVIQLVRNGAMPEEALQRLDKLGRETSAP